jgi:hypothetical protein
MIVAVVVWDEEGNVETYDFLAVEKLLGEDGGQAAEHVVACIDDHHLGAEARAGHHGCWREDAAELGAASASERKGGFGP